MRGAKRTISIQHTPPPPSLSSNGRPAACVVEKWIGCLLAKVGTGANAVCIIRWHVSANVLCMRTVGRHATFRRPGRPQVRPAQPGAKDALTSEWVCVWIHTFRTQLGDHSRTRLSISHTHKHSPRQQRGRIAHKQRPLLAPENTCNPSIGSSDVFLGITFKLSPQVSRAHTHADTNRQTTARSLYCLTITWQYFIYGSTVIWRERALQKDGNPHTNTHRVGYCKCV